MKSPKPYSVGRTVLYVPKQGENFGGNEQNVLPAIVVATWEHTGYQNDEVNLKVITDAPQNAWRTSVPFSSDKEPGTWHWPEIK